MYQVTLFNGEEVMKRTFAMMTLAAIVGSLLISSGDRSVSGHCQVPCGIYDDAARLKAMEEDATTIGKAVTKITELSAGLESSSLPQNINQMVRWINTKEQHASSIIETVSLYFLTQKVKHVSPDDAGYEDYTKKLADHHAVLRAAMKVKQTVDADAVKQLQTAIHMLSHHYIEHDHTH